MSAPTKSVPNDGGAAELLDDDPTSRLPRPAFVVPAPDTTTDDWKLTPDQLAAIRGDAP